MTIHSQSAVQSQLAQIVQYEEQAGLLAYSAQNEDVFMTDESGQSIYDAAAEADTEGVWVFLGNAINSNQMVYGQDWQQNPSIDRTLPDDVALGVPEAATISTGAKWLIGGMAAGLMAWGIGGGGGDHHDNRHEPPQSMPKPHQLVQQFSSSHNPENPDERATVVQAETPENAFRQPEPSESAFNQITLFREPEVDSIATPPDTDLIQKEYSADAAILPIESLESAPTEQLG